MSEEGTGTRMRRRRVREGVRRGMNGTGGDVTKKTSKNREEGVGKRRERRQEKKGKEKKEMKWKEHEQV